MPRLSLQPLPRGAPATEFIGLLVSAARRRIKQAVLASAAPHRLAPQQFWFLVALLERPGMSQVELGERSLTDPPTTSRVVSVLARRRLVRADVDPRDHRCVRLSLTAAGERLAVELSSTAREIRSAVIEGMSQGEQDALRAGLRRVIANLDRLAFPATRGAATRRAGVGP
jgi:DNA-binding MarR family transcriptional regulator